MRARLRSPWLPVLALVLAGVGIVGDSPARCARASDISPTTDYCYELPIVLTNGSGAALTDYAARVMVPAAGLVTAGQLDSRAWDLLPISGNISNEVDVLAQSLNVTSAPWWVHVPGTWANGGSVTARLYFGSGEQKRDQGVLLTGADSLSTPHHADFNITNALFLDAELNLLAAVLPAQTTTVATHWDSGQGYRLLLVNSGGALTLRAQANVSVCDVTWNAAWTNTNRDIQYEFTAPNIILRVDGVMQATCNTGLGAITNPAANPAFGVGSGISRAIVREVQVRAGTTIRAKWGFDARYVAETVATNPYQGTVQDFTAGDHDLTYTFNRPQTGLTVAVGSLGLAGSSTGDAAVGTAVPNLLGPAFGVGSLVATPGPTPTGAFHLLVGQNLQAVGVGGPPQGMIMAVFFGSISLLLAWQVWRKIPYVPLVVFAMGIPLVYGVLQGYLDWWWLLLWIVFTLSSWWAVRLGEER